MAYLLDTNILLRTVEASSPSHQVAVDAVAFLILDGETLYITPQNIIEFWSVATRPASSRGGLGLTPAMAQKEVEQFETHFELLPDTESVYGVWKSLVESTGVSGVQVHDARLAAVAQAHGITHLLSFDADDFKRYGLIAVTPQSIIESLLDGTG